MKTTPKLHWLDADDPPDRFPDPAESLADPDGLLAIGGDLSVPRLLAAYRRGIFPWYQDAQPILWWSPSARAILRPEEFHLSRSLRRTLRRGHFELRFDTAFADVIDACATVRRESGTWITPEMKDAYLDLYEQGYAHCAEAWHGSELAGGIYGVHLGQMFFGESMFSRQTDGSKVALAGIALQSRNLGVRMIDCQLPTGHLSSLGSRQIPRTTFLQLVKRYTALPAAGEWRLPPLSSRELLPG